MNKLFTFLHITHYLQDLYTTRKAQDPNFSYDVWAKELGIKNRSFLRLVVVGKRSLNEELAQKLIHWIQLDAIEEAFFRDLIQYSQSKTQEQKRFFGKKLVGYLKKEVDLAEVESRFDFLSDPDLPSLKTMLSFNDIDKSIDGLASVTGKHAAVVEQNLKKLEVLGLAAKNENSHWETKDKSFKVKDSFGDLGLQMYHEESLKRAIAARSLSPDCRRYRSLLVPLGKEDYDVFLKDLQEFVAKTLTKFDTDEIKDKQLYQINFNLFPVFQKLTE